MEDSPPTSGIKPCKNRFAVGWMAHWITMLSHGLRSIVRSPGLGCNSYS